METNWEEIEENQEIKQEFADYKSGLMRHSQERLVLTPGTVKMLSEYQRMEARPEDVWVVSYPKCGTTWTQEMVWQVANNLDLEGGKVMLDERFPFLEAETLWKPSEFGWSGRMIAGLFKVWEWGTSWRWNRPKSWFGYKSTVEMLEDSSKRRGHNYVGDLPGFVRRFMKEQLMYDPFFSHLEEAWGHRESENLLFIWFEEMKTDLRSVVERVSQFLDSPLSPDQTDQLLNHLDFKNFKNNPAVNNEVWKSFGLTCNEGNFIRKGEVGGWKRELENYPETEEELLKWVQEKMESSQIEFPTK